MASTTPIVSTRAPLHLLEEIPTEVRLKIYHLVIKSETGILGIWKKVEDRDLIRFATFNITGNSVNRSKPIELDLLRVCKKIYNEASDILWKENKLWLCETLIERLARQSLPYLDNVSHIALRFTLQSSMSPASASLSTALQNLVSRGKIQSITLQAGTIRISLETLLYAKRVAEGTSGTMTKPLEDVYPTNYGSYLKVLRRWNREGSPLRTVKKKMELATGWDEMPGPLGLAGRGWMRRWAGSMKFLKSIIEDLESAFGGEVWVDGVMCYKGMLSQATKFLNTDEYQDHIQYANPFPLKPLPAGVTEKVGVELVDLEDFVFVPPSSRQEK